MVSGHARAYRAVLTQLRQSMAPPRRVNRQIAAQFRVASEQDLANAANFLKAQREHKLLLERYNPLFDLTAEERIEATARRVGLNMPKTVT